MPSAASPVSCWTADAARRYHSTAMAIRGNKGRISQIRPPQMIW